MAIDFDSCLSGGERQRLGFARLLLQRSQLGVVGGMEINPTIGFRGEMCRETISLGFEGKNHGFV